MKVVLRSEFIGLGAYIKKAEESQGWVNSLVGKMLAMGAWGPEFVALAPVGKNSQV